MDTYWNIKKQIFRMPDGTTLEIESAKNYKFVVATADPSWRILARCCSRKAAAASQDYYMKIWAHDPSPIEIISRESFTYPERDRARESEPAPASACDPNWKPPAGWKIGDPL